MMRFAFMAFRTGLLSREEIQRPDTGTILGALRTRSSLADRFQFGPRGRDGGIMRLLQRECVALDQRTRILQR